MVHTPVFETGNSIVASFFLSEMQVKGAAFTFHRLHTYASFVQHHDLLAETEPDAAAAALGAKKGNENFIHQLGWHAGAIICNAYHYFV